MKYLPHITIAAALLALLTSGKLRTSTLIIGVSAGAIATYQSRPKAKHGLSEEEMLELAIASAFSQANDEVERKLVLINQREKEAEAIEEIALAEKQEQIENLNRQISDLAELLEEQLAEIDKRDEENRIRAEQYFFEKRRQLEELALEDERSLEVQAQQLANELETDKQEFLGEYRGREQRLSDRIAFLEQELAAALWQLDKHERPQLPEGVEPDKVAARRVIEILYGFGVVCDYYGSWAQTNYIYVRVRPRDCGLETIGKRKHLERIRLELGLIEEPEVGPVQGAVELCLKPKYLAPIPVDGFHPNSSYKPPHPEVTEENAIATLNAAYLKDFIEPQTHLNPYGDIQQIELDWVNWLWNYAAPRPIRNQKTIIYRIWRAKSGDGKRFIKARDRLSRIKRELGIDKGKGNGAE